MSTFTRTLLLLILLGGQAVSAFAQELSASEMQSLDGQVQEIKSDVLNIASELSTLEERLLYPSNTQVAVFVSMDEEQDFRLDAVEVEIDGNLATHHIYSFKELDALQKGGVQRIYTGNVATGEHEISVTMSGKLKNGKDFSETERFTFNKDVKPKAVGITLAGPGLGKTTISVGDW
jgi:hypothetical protein